MGWETPNCVTLELSKTWVLSLQTKGVTLGK